MLLELRKIRSLLMEISAMTPLNLKNILSKRQLMIQFLNFRKTMLF